MKRYEAMVIIKPDMNKEELDRTVSSMQDAITKNGGKVESCQKWARRQLAYSIKKHREGDYYLLDFEAEPKSITAVENVYKLNESILRAMITVKE